MPGFDKSMRGKMNELYNSVENGDTPTPYSKLDGKDDVEDTKPLDDTQLSSFSGAVLNTFNTMVGVGTLSLPFALRHGGWVMLALLFVVYILGIQAARLIGIMMDDDSTLKSYPNIAEKAFGTKGKTLVAIVFSIELFCACGMFMVLAGDTLHSLFPHISQRTFVLGSSIVMIPTALTTRLDFLAYLSFIGMTSSTMLCMVIIYLGGLDAEGSGAKMGSYLNPQPTRIFTTFEEAPFSIGLCIVGFAGHAVFPTIKNSMRNKNLYDSMMITSFTLALLFYLTIAVLGYLMYGDFVEKEIDLNFRAESGHQNAKKITFAAVAVTLTSWLVAINPATKFGLCMNPVAKNLEQVFGVQDSQPKRLFLRITLSGLCLSMCILLLSLLKWLHSLGLYVQAFPVLFFLSLRIII